MKIPLLPENQPHNPRECNDRGHSQFGLQKLGICVGPIPGPTVNMCFYFLVDQHIRVVVASVCVGIDNLGDKTRHDQSSLKRKLVRYTLPLRSGSRMATGRKQDCLSQWVQDENLHYSGKTF